MDEEGQKRRVWHNDGVNDSAEVTDLVGVYLLHKIGEKFPEIVGGGLYRDDALFIVEKFSNGQIERTGEKNDNREWKNKNITEKTNRKMERKDERRNRKREHGVIKSKVIRRNI